MYKIQTDHNLPSISFDMLSPWCLGNTIRIFRSKRPNFWASTKVVVNTGKFAAFHVELSSRTSNGQSHGQAWFYIVAQSRKAWRHLTLAQQELVLQNFDKAHTGAISPGELKDGHRIAYKLVEFRDDRFFSLFKPEFEYVLGKCATQQARKGRRGGFYAFTTEESALAFQTAEMGRGLRSLALLQVEIYGRIIKYGDQEVAATYLRPVRRLEITSSDDAVADKHNDTTI